MFVDKRNAEWGPGVLAKNAYGASTGLAGQLNIETTVFTGQFMQ